MCAYATALCRQYNGHLATVVGEPELIALRRSRSRSPRGDRPSSTKRKFTEDPEPDAAAVKEEVKDEPRYAYKVIYDLVALH